jgi:hypothetical protein
MPVMHSFSTPAQVEAFITAFEARRLPRDQWTHHGHLVAGLWYVTRVGYPECLDTVRMRIWQHNESVGTANTDDGGYHETVTRAYLQSIAQFVASSSSHVFETLVTGLLTSPVAQKDWLLRFYSKEVLFSVAARREWIAPDVAAIAIPSQ